ncbi:hypothetical protein ACQPZF_05905 [Actinosynnema sp. CS-041913]|uniref:hypothetical protein n=1 Tax=Actinosynnema sp. CS-041913 TaxID=3239917 RepID=UPI003D92CF2D
MTTDKIDGDTAAMSLFSQQLSAPPLPPSLARLGTPPNLSGLFEGMAMTLLDKAATAEVAAYLTKVTEEFVTYRQKVGTAAATYTAADVTAVAGLVSAGAQLAQQGLGMAQQVAGPTGQPPTDEDHDPQHAA